MKKKSVFKIEIATPCMESWSEMTPVDGGRFCDSCTKKVIDFSTWTDREIVQYARSNRQPTCGRFLDSQLNRNLLYLEKERTNSFMPALLVSTALAAGIASSAAASTNTKPSGSVSAQVDTIPSFKAATGTNEDDIPSDVSLNAKLIPGDGPEQTQFNRWTYNIRAVEQPISRWPALVELLEIEQLRDSVILGNYNTKDGMKRLLDIRIMVDYCKQKKAQDMAAMRMGAFGIAVINADEYATQQTYDIMGTGAYKKKKEPDLFNSVKYDGKVWPPVNPTLP